MQSKMWDTVRTIFVIVLTLCILAWTAAGVTALNALIDEHKANIDVLQVQNERIVAAGKASRKREGTTWNHIIKPMYDWATEKGCCDD